MLGSNGLGIEVQDQVRVSSQLQLLTLVCVCVSRGGSIGGGEEDEVMASLSHLDRMANWREMWNPRLSMSLTSTKGLLNAPGDNNCFLNSAVQVGHIKVISRPTQGQYPSYDVQLGNFQCGFIFDYVTDKQNSNINLSAMCLHS